MSREKNITKPGGKSLGRPEKQTAPHLLKKHEKRYLSVTLFRISFINLIGNMVKDLKRQIKAEERKEG